MLITQNLHSARWQYFRKFLSDWSILFRWNRRIMSFDNDSFHSEARRVVEKNRDNLINSRSDHCDKIAPFLKSHFHDVDEIKKRNLLNINLCFTEFFLNFFNSFNWLTLICVLVHYFDWDFNFLLLCFFKVFWNSRSRVFVSDLQNVFFYCLSTSSCHDSFVDFSDFVWFKFIDDVLYDLNHVNWFDTWHGKYFSRALCVSLIIITLFF